MDQSLDALGIEPLNGKYLIKMSQSDLMNLEQRLQVRLPNIYRWFLLNYGGIGFRHHISFRPISPLPEHLSVSGIGDIDFLYGPESDARDEYSLMEMLRCYSDRMPENLIPIGGEIGGNQICLGIRGPEAGKIYYWDHHNEWDEEDYLEQGLPVPPDMKFQNVHLIADSFEDFIARLYIAEAADE
jgi:SMI1 / KNR4 family (SUKH-1)